MTGAAAPAYWRHDLAGCLHTCMAGLLDFHGHDPLEVLGAAWQFAYTPGDVRREEYYFPCPPGRSLLSSMAPYHPVSSTWHRPASAEEGWAQVRARVDAGTPVAVAVDNFELPFRPAYRDVHANHLILVHGYDDARGTVAVSDPVPPRFAGDIRQSELTASRSSGNAVQHDRDMFFTDAPIAGRWLDIDVSTDAFPVFDRPFVRHVIETNIHGFEAPPDPAVAPLLHGLAGQQIFLDDMTGRYGRGETVVDELFVLAGVQLATSALHADWLAHGARTFGVPELGEAARRVERTAHHWSAIRILAARTRTGHTAAVQLGRRFDDLMSDHRRSLRDLRHALASL
ncbi:BtrH N-terminal domain-containing protein [Streptomyces sp. NPDC014894]|uniref:BtrH N-terminal domain-containing protein n=1 Tax=Streptomyces sp. NPDC014894 TaxID=3364931 RepID=UPI0036FC64FD